MTPLPNLIVGFSFSLMPDGAPGSYNVALAKHLAQQLELQRKSEIELPLVALQWEIADALEALNPKIVLALRDSHKFFVVTPPLFQANEVNEELLAGFLEHTKSKHGETLSNSISNQPGIGVLEKLNGLLSSDQFYENFSDHELSNLTRPRLGSLFTEFRMLPNLEEYPFGLRTYQRIRVNRLIVESVIDDGRVLKRGQYLSTVGVIAAVCEFCGANNIVLKDAGLLAHPLHLPRCIEQSIQVFDERDLDVSVTGVSPNETPQWDETGAQVWCQSLTNWTSYEEKVREFLRNDS